MQGSHELGIHLTGIDTLLFEIDCYADASQFSNILQTLFGISGEAGDGFNKDSIDKSLSAIRQQALEFIALVCGCAGDTLVCVDVDESPVFVAGNQRDVMVRLCDEGIQLIGGIRTDTSVCRNTKLCFLNHLHGIDGNDFLVVQR